MIQVMIERDAEGRLKVWQGEKNSEQVCVGEMIEQVLKLLELMPGPVYAMKTDAEWQQRFNKQGDQGQ